MPRPRVSHYRIVVSGHIVEAFQLTKPVGYNLVSSKSEKPYRKRRALSEQQITASSLSRTRNRLIRLINANSRRWFDENKTPINPQFITYTFKENRTNVSEANYFFTNYIKRLNYQIFETKSAAAKYVVVPEFQKRGAVHYHAVFFNLPMVNAREEFVMGQFGNIWDHGNIKKKNIKNVPNVGLYMTKYMTKDATDRRLVGRKKYFSSRGLLQPEIVTHEHIADEIMDYLANLKATYAYMTMPTENRPVVENPTFCATYNLTPEQLSELRSFYTFN